MMAIRNKSCIKEIDTILPPPPQNGHKKLYGILFILIAVSILLVYLNQNQYKTESVKTNPVINKKQTVTQKVSPGTGNITKKIDPQKNDSMQKIINDKEQFSVENNKTVIEIEKRTHLSISNSSFSEILDFDHNSTALTSSSVTAIKEIINRISDKHGRMILKGFYDPEKLYIQLAEKRVKNVAKALRESGLNKNIRIWYIYLQDVKNQTINSDENRSVKIHFIPDN